MPMEISARYARNDHNPIEVKLVHFNAFRTVRRFKPVRLLQTYYHP